MRRPGPRALDVEKGVLTRQFKDGGLRQAEGGALLRKGLGRCGMGEFMKMLYAYLVWYRDKRCKSDLGYMSPMQYRRSLGLVA